jgi:hypothetical protein
MSEADARSKPAEQLESTMDSRLAELTAQLRSANERLNANQTTGEEIQQVMAAVRAYARLDMRDVAIAVTAPVVAVIAIAICWLTRAPLVAAGADTLSGVPTAVLACSFIILAVHRIRLYQRTVRLRLRPSDDGDDWASAMVTTVRTEVWHLYALAVGLIWASSSLVVAVVACGFTRRDDTLLMSRSGVLAGVWETTDTIPLVAVPHMLDITAPAIEGTPLTFRVCLAATRLAVVLGLFAVIQHFVNRYRNRSRL